MEDEDIVSPPLPPFVYDAAVEKHKQFVAERMRKKENRAAANEPDFSPEAEPADTPSLPYADRDDDELEQNEKGE